VEAGRLMPRGPKGQMCATDVIGNAIIVVRVASAHLLQARRGCSPMMSLSDTPQTVTLPYRRPS
jgi:hypothetical protein